MKKKMKKIISVVIAVAMVASLLPTSFATTEVEAAKSTVSFSSSYKSGKYYTALKNVSLTGNPRTDIVNIAKSQIGYQESASSSSLSGTVKGNKNCTEYGRWYGRQDEWSAMFVSWCAAIAGVHSGIVLRHCYIPTGVKFFKNQKRMYSRDAVSAGRYKPQPGDIIYFKSSEKPGTVGHIGIVKKYSNSKIYTIEGNTSSTTTSTKGGAVVEKSYSVKDKKIAYVCKPNYKDTGLTGSAVNPSFKKGATGSDIRKLQRNLIGLGYLKDKVDGKYDAAVETAVKSYEKARSLKADGIADSTMIKKLNKQVTDIQKSLYKLGYKTVGKSSGNYDSKTTAAVKSFQKDNGLQQTGIANSTTRSKISKAIKALDSAGTGEKETTSKIEKETTSVKETTSKVEEATSVTEKETTEKVEEEATSASDKETTSAKETTEKATTEKKTTAKPTTEKVTTEKVTTAKPTTEKVTTEKVTTEKVTTEKATTEKVTTEKATTEKPTTEKVTTEKVTTEKATTEKPTTEKATTEKATTEKATTEKQTTTKEEETTSKEEETTTKEEPAGTVLENIVVGVNEKYIGEGYQKTISDAFKEYVTEAGYKFNVEYRTLGDSTTTAEQLGEIINAAKDIDFVLAAGENIDTKAGVTIITKSKMIDKYNSDGSRYGALLTEKMSAVLMYNFVTGMKHHIYDDKNDATCNICGYERAAYAKVAFENGVNVNFISGIDSSASNTPKITDKTAITFTADSDKKDEVWEINLGGKKLNPNKRYTVTFNLYNEVGNVGIGCVRDKYISGMHGINTYYGNFSNKKLASTDGYKVRVRRGVYEISDIVDGSRITFPYDKAKVDSNGYIGIKMEVEYNGTTYVNTIYYLDKSSNWVKLDEAYIGVSSSNTFGLYVLHGAQAGCVCALKDVEYIIEDRTTTYSSSVATPAIKLIDYNVQTGNTYYTKTAEWLLSESPDVIGLQEVGPNWYKSLKSSLGGTYGYIGVPRSGTSSTNSGNEASPIFYKKSKYALIKSGTKWLSSTPDVVGSRISGSEYIRVMTYAVLYHKATGTIYIYVNTHLDNADDGSIRVKQVNILMDIVADLPNYPTVLTGDLNGGLSSQVITAIQNKHGYTSLARKAETQESTYKTNTFWETSSPTILDYIFLSDMNKFNALYYEVGNTSSRCSVYNRSDHYPLISKFALK